MSKKIQSESKPNCFICGEQAKLLYAEQKDRLFDVPGLWNIVQCENTDCRLVWLNPMPKKIDIGLAYKRYYTHSDNNEQDIKIQPFPLLLWFLKITGFQAKKQHSYFLYLDKIKPGKLLEIGCGDGQRLISFKKLGWDVLGQETDPHTVKKIKEIMNINVLSGPIEQQNLPENSFDAIIMNHVLEHLYHPLELINECYRLLKPGGILSIVTPNVQSMGHYYFKNNWRGLEPPRHLYIYSYRSLQRLFRQTSFDNVTINTTAMNAAGTITQESLKLKNGNILESNFKVKVFSHLFRILEFILLLLKKEWGEECVVLAIKEGDNNGTFH